MGKKKSLDLVRNRIKSKKGATSDCDDTDLVRSRNHEQENEDLFIVENKDRVLKASKEQLIELVKLIQGGLNINDLNR